MQQSLGNPTGVPDQTTERAELFYRKGANKTIFAGLNRDLDTVSGEIKALDVSATTCHKLRSDLTVAQAAEASSWQAKHKLDQPKSKLANLDYTSRLPKDMGNRHDH